jgi:16S rRNA (guanine527-N7)-methyltransferase
MTRADWPTLLAQAAEIGLSVSASWLPQLEKLLDLLVSRAARLGLTAITDPTSAATKHVLDSLTCLKVMEKLAPGRKVVDVGSGAGLPGIPLAIARPDIEFCLLESSKKGCGFLEDTARELELSNIKVRCMRAEEAGQDASLRENFDMAVCRAVARLVVVAEYCLPLVRVGGLVVAMKGPAGRDELSEAQAALSVLGGEEEKVVEFDIAIPASSSAAGESLRRLLICIAKKRLTPAKYPRRTGIPSKRPLKGV